MVDKEMVIQEGFTKSCQKIVDEKFAAQQMISQALGFPEREAEHFEACYREVFDDFMPEEVTLGQAPKTAHIGERVVGIQANAVRDGQGQIQSLLFNLSDITALVAAEEQNKVNKALLKILGQKEAFLSFIVDVKNLLVEAYELATVPSPNENRLRIILHTIKGNCGAVGLSDQADLVHHIEDKTQIEKKDIQDISSSFRHFLELHRNVLHIDFEKLAKLGYTVSGESLEALQARLMSGLGQDELLEVVYQWIAQVKLVPAEGLFANLADLVVRVAERVMKQVEFEFVGKEVLVDPEKLKPILQVLPHVIRNCLDHGIEPPYERGDKGDTGHLRLELSDHPDHWTLVIQDDGRGINTDKLVEKSIAAGAFTAEDAAKMSKADKLHLIFADGVSTAEQVSDVSGRGVGMAAVLEAVQTAGGSLKLDSEMGKGTRFTIQIRK
ncbi:MAG: ATP-binding protein [Zetaproteobacteria bacterium]|nr:ATP-binding protein [Zetaproteobacteria bacterium]